ncbi:MAG: hypothetical protein ACREKL_09140 [Chthoniobacterales bacterium]
MLRAFSRPLAILSLAVLAGCATTPQVDPQLTAAVAAHNVNSATYNKIYNGQVLDYADIENLVVKKVPSQTIVSYLQSTQKTYDFTYSQLSGLKADGASSQLLNYLSESQGFYGYYTSNSAAHTKKVQKDKYYRDGLYQDEQPFAYNAPIVDDWYDSAYEESLYSPFSMD